MSRKTQWTLLVLAMTMGLYLMVSSSPVQMGWWTCKSFINPKLDEQTEQLFRTKQNAYLLRKLKSKVYVEVGIAAEILRERKDVKEVPVLMGLLNSRGAEIRGIAIANLASWGDARGIEQLMKIVEQGRDHRDYLDVVDALSIVHYEPIYPEILKITKDGLHNSYAIGMLARFPERSETLPTMEMIADHDPHIYIRDKAKEEIRKITLGQAAAK